MKTGIFVGSFNPYTIGHDDIVRRALPLFDRLVIGVVGDNVNKPSLKPAAERAEAIISLYKDEPRVSVKTYSGLAMDFAKQEGARFIVKGVRNFSDFAYEQEQAQVNHLVGGIDTVFFFTDPQLAPVSSTMVRELAHFGADVSPYLPKRKGQ